MKRFLSGLTAAMVLLASVQLTAFADGSDTDQPVGDANGTLSVLLKMDYPEKTSAVESKNLTVTLRDSAGTQYTTLPLTAANEPEQDFTVGSQKCSAKAAGLNEDGTPITTESEIHYFRADFSGVPNNQSYQVSLKGEGYKSFSSEPIEIKEYSRELLVSTGDGSFTIGDLNGDNQVDQNDLALVEENLGKTEPQADLNNDGKVDITDIALVNRHIGIPGGAELYDTELLAAAVATLKELPSTVTVTEGKAEDILSDDAPAVTFQAQAQAEIQIPVTFTRPLEMEQIKMITPDVPGAVREGTARVEYLDELGNEASEEIPFSYDVPDGVHALTRDAGRNTIVINLGKRVAVKKITITVSKVKDEDGKPSYAVVDTIQFLKDIVPENPATDGTVPKNLQAQEQDGKVTLTWKAVNNVGGYLVKYGTSSENYTRELAVEAPTAEVTGLKNLEPYYFVVCSTSGDWRSSYSAEITATPQPSAPPSAPDNLKLKPIDQGLIASWGKTKNADRYSVYYKKSADSEYICAAKEISETSFGIANLENGVEYSVYVTAGNQFGESKPSLISTEVPQKEEIEPPKLPTLNRIENSQVAKVEMKNPNNVKKEDYPNGFSVNNVIDGDFSTHWAARAWWESSEFTFTFQEGQEYTMDYLVYVPRLDGNYRESLDKYTITVWDKDGNQTKVASGQKVTNTPESTGVAILPFPKTEHIHKIAVSVAQWSGSPTNISLSEIAFYEYSDIDSQIKSLFANSSLTKLASGVTQEQIDMLKAQVSSTEGYYVNQKILLDELSVAQGLLNQDQSVLGRVLDGVESRNTAGNIRAVNTFQPLGVVANANKEVVIYADIPDGETVQVVPTQYYAEASSWAGGSIRLANGRNVITIPQLTTVSGEKGGALYLQYSGEKAEQIKLQVRGAATKIPVLELSNWDQMSEQESTGRISAYAEELEAYAAALGNKNLQTNIRNSTEISLPNVLLSFPASQVYKGIQGDPEQMLYSNTLAWKDLIQVLYRTHGIDDPSQERSRQNIRYARMFDGAFMYASGAHIGVGYGSTAGLVKGQPVSETGTGNPNKLFGWGIAHEIGHVMDTLGKAEITNNIYSLFGQTYDGDQNTQTSRLEGGIYDRIFQKTAVGSVGQANDVFTSLGMYWQLHLAYDGASDNFYNELNKAYRSGAGSGLSGDDKLAVVASQVAGYDLTEFFERWGIVLSGSAKSQMSGQKDPRAIWYLSDDSRRARLSGSGAGGGSISSVNVSLNGNQADISIAGPSSGIQGYEISRNNKVIGFTKEPSFTDTIGSYNNIELVYTVKAYDILGNLISEAQSQGVKLEHENLISRGEWTSSTQPDGSILVHFNKEQAVSGIKISPAATGADTPNQTPNPDNGGKDPSKDEAQTPDTGTKPNPDGGDGETPDPNPDPNPDESKDPEPNPNPDQNPDESKDPEPKPNPDQNPDESKDPEPSPNPDQTPDGNGDGSTNGGQAGPEPGTEGDKTQQGGASDATGTEPQSLSYHTASIETERNRVDQYAGVQSAALTEENDGMDKPELSADQADKTFGTDTGSESNPDTNPGNNGNGSGETGDGTNGSNGDTGNGSGETGDGTNGSNGDTGNGSGETGDGSNGTDGDSGNGSGETGDGTNGSNGDTGNGSGGTGTEPSTGGTTVTPSELTKIEVSVNGADFTTVFEKKLETPDIIRTYLFTRNNAEDGSIGIFDANYLRITNLPEGITISQMDFLSYPGDTIEISDTAIGYLANSYDAIPAGTLIVTGTYRGDPVYNTIRINGKFLEGQAETGEQELVERALNGDVYLFAEIPEEGDMAEVGNGIWIFVPDVQREAQLTEGSCFTSVLPSQIRAELYRTDSPDSADGKRLVSNTLWVSTPTEETMPQIILGGPEN